MNRFRQTFALRGTHAFSAWLCISAVFLTLSACGGGGGGGGGGGSTGNGGSTSDTTPPSTPVINSVVTPTNSTTQTLSGDKEADSSILIDGTEVVALDANTTWNFSVNLTTEGDNIFSITSKDAAGNESTAATATIVLDTTAPTVPVVNAVTSPTNATTQTLGGTKEANSSILIGGTLAVALNTSTTWSASVNLTIEGGNAFSITSKDALGNESTAASANIVRDTTAPAKPTINVVTTPTNVGTQTLNGNKDAEASIYINGSLAVALDSTTTWSSIVSFSTEQAYAYSITSRDVLGNASAAANTSITYDITPPGMATDLKSSSTDGQVKLSWINPVTADFSHTVIRRKVGGPPTSPTDGTAVSVNPDGISAIQTGLANGDYYNYKTFATDTAGNATGGLSIKTQVLSLDPSFGGGAGYILGGTIVSQFDYGRRLMMDGSKIVVVGYGDSNADTGLQSFDMTLWRFNTDGSPDTTFGGSGVVQYNAGVGNDVGYSLAMDSGKYLVSGGSDQATQYRATLWRFNANGTLDTTFGGDLNSDTTPDGFTVFAGMSYTAAIDLAVNSTSGHIFVATEINALQMFRLIANTGLVDSTFGTSGQITYSQIYPNFPYSVRLDGNGKVVVAGTCESSFIAYRCLWRMNPDGSLDTTFGVDYDISGSPDGYIYGADSTYGMSIGAGSGGIIDHDFDSGGKILLAVQGYISGPTYHTTVQRYNTNGTLDTTFGSSGTAIATDMQMRVYAVVVDAFDRIVVVGQGEASNTNMMMLRLTATGALDTSFNGVGYAVFRPTKDVLKSYGYDVTLDGSGNILITGYGNNSSAGHSMILWRFLP